MTDWEMRTKLNCPTCNVETTSLELKIGFIFVDGLRHKSHSTWALECGHEIHDDLTDWDTNEDSEGRSWAAIIDHDATPLLVWCDGKMTEHEDHDS